MEIVGHEGNSTTSFLLANLIYTPLLEGPFHRISQTARLGQVTHAHTVRQCPSTLRFADFLLLHTFLQGFGWSGTTKGETLHEACRGSEQDAQPGWLLVEVEVPISGDIKKTQQMEFKASAAPVFLFPVWDFENTTKSC